MKNTLKRVVTAISALAVVAASSISASAANCFGVIDLSNNCNTGFDPNNCYVSVGSYCPDLPNISIPNIGNTSLDPNNCYVNIGSYCADYSDICSVLKTLGLEGIFDKYTSYACNIDCAVTDPGTDCDTDDCATAPDTGYFTPDHTPSYPDAPTTDDTTTNTDTSITDDSVSEYEKRVVELVNVERAKYGLSALTLNAELSAVARAKSQDMKDNGYFSHTSPTYGSPFDMMKSFGIKYNTAGENIAYGYRTPEAVVEGWMNSEGHRANILNSSYKEIGVGYVASGNYWTQMFIG